MTDFTALTDAQINRWVAERDNDDMWLRATDMDGNEEVLSPNYANRSDAALALLDRWGYEWRRTWDPDEKMYVAEVYTPDRNAWRACYESPTCDFTRALLNAACPIKESEEV